MISKNLGPLPLETRKKRLHSLKKAIQGHEESIFKALKEDLGKSSFESYLTESGFILEEIKLVSKKLSCWSRPKKVSTPLNLFPGQSTIRPEPYGVVLIISPWNYPFQLCLSPLIGAIAAGNRVVLKPSEYAPHTTSVIEKIIREVFLPEEVLVSSGGVEKTQELLKYSFDYIFFTGSTEVGKFVMKAAADHLTPLTLELGGKSPCLIDSSAHIDLAAKRCVWGKFLNAGQTCVAPDFVLIPRALQDQFVERVKFYLDSFYGTNPIESPDYPRIINERHFDRLMGLLMPEKTVLGGENLRSALFLAPTVMKDVEWKDQVMQEEIFGPILPIIPFDHLEETVEKISKLPKPLAFYFFSENRSLIDEIMSKISFGGGCVNDTIIHLANPHLPFGGVGQSGMGSYHGKKSFDTFSHYKSIFHQRTWIDNSLRYPPYSGKLKWLRLFLR